MTIPEFFKAFPFIKVTGFAREIGVDPGAFNRYVQEYTEPPEWVVESFKMKVFQLSVTLGIEAAKIHFNEIKEKSCKQLNN